ncbi:MAG: hypothetical protein HY842_04960 [Bacteroidetes bacterium]|nr:hypothetical protein [Bacteroidota bacterium]
MRGKINVVEMDDQLVFTNLGSFIPGSVEKVVIEDSPEEQYRNPFLATAMFNLQMVDTVGGGIRKIFNFQRARFFPMPDYDFSNHKVKVTITGKVLDMEFARVLAQHKDLSLEEIIMLDRVQKRKPIPKTEAKHLRSKKLIEGRKPNFIIAANVATLDKDLKAQYIKHKGFDDSHYKDMILEYLQKFNSASRQDIDRLLHDKLPGVLGDAQKKSKINNLISNLRMKGKIKNTGSSKKPNWEAT